MKKLLLFIFAVCLCISAFAQQYGWIDITNRLPDFPTDTFTYPDGKTINTTLYDMYFINDNEGWIINWHPLNYIEWNDIYVTSFEIIWITVNNDVIQISGSDQVEPYKMLIFQNQIAKYFSVSEFFLKEKLQNMKDLQLLLANDIWKWFVVKFFKQQTRKSLISNTQKSRIPVT